MRMSVGAFEFDRGIAEIDLAVFNPPVGKGSHCRESYIRKSSPDDDRPPRGTDLLDTPRIHDDDPIGEFQRFFLVVSDEDAGDLDFLMQAVSHRRNSWRTFASSAPNGSSSSSTFGSTARVRANATR